MNESTPTYKKVIEQLVKEFLSGTHSIGEKLPPERQLAGTLQVSRTALREALRYLSEMGAIQSRQGGGHYLRVAHMDDAEANRTSMHLVSDPASAAEMLEVRRALECEAAYLAASRATKQQLIEMESYLHNMKSAATEEDGARADIGFHLTVVSASQNPLLIQAVDGLVNDMERNIQSTRRKRFGSDVSRYQTTYEEHEVIFQAIAQQRPQEARHAMATHLDRAYQEIWQP